MTDLPDPLVPAEVDLRDFQYMELDVQMLRDSRFVSEVKPEAFRAGVMLWCASWHQVPAGSVPNNDVELAKLAGYGFAVREWKRVKAEALTKFVLCSDGRLYHEWVSAKAVAAWRARLDHFYERAKDRLRKANKARALENPPRPPLPELSFDQWNERRQAGGCPMEKAEAFDGIPQKAPTPSAGIPPENALKGTEKERNGEGNKEEARALPAPQKPEPPPPLPVDHERDPDGAFDPPEPPPEPAAFAPSPAARAAKVMRQAGLQAVNPGDPRLIALCQQGATDEEFRSIAEEAVAKDKGMAWVLVVLAKRREEAAAVRLAPPVPITPPSRDAERTEAYLREQFKPLTAEEQARADEARRRAVAAVRGNRGPAT